MDRQMYFVTPSIRFQKMLTYFNSTFLHYSFIYRIVVYKDIISAILCFYYFYSKCVYFFIFYIIFWYILHCFFYNKTRVYLVSKEEYLLK